VHVAGAYDADGGEVRHELNIVYGLGGRIGRAAAAGTEGDMGNDVLSAMPNMSPLNSIFHKICLLQH
jgi:hypothetical protein